MGLLDTNSSVDLSCNNGDIRLIGGTNALEGSVECVTIISGLSVSSELAT